MNEKSIIGNSISSAYLCNKEALYPSKYKTRKVPKMLFPIEKAKIFKELRPPIL